jgi:hypothetical protein
MTTGAIKEEEHIKIKKQDLQDINADFHLLNHVLMGPIYITIFFHTQIPLQMVIWQVPVFFEVPLSLTAAFLSQ